MNCYLPVMSYMRNKEVSDADLFVLAFCPLSVWVLYCVPTDKCPTPKQHEVVPRGPETPENDVGHGSPTL